MVFKQTAFIDVVLIRIVVFLATNTGNFVVKIPRKKIPKGMEPEPIQKFISVNIQTIIRFSIQRDATDYFIRFECMILIRQK